VRKITNHSKKSSLIGKEQIIEFAQLQNIQMNKIKKTCITKIKKLVGRKKNECKKKNYKKIWKSNGLLENDVAC
jgi:hypothetical protein